MKKISRKFLSSFAVLALVCTLFSTFGFVLGKADSSVLFKDEFTGGLSGQWSDPQAGMVVGGVYALSGSDKNYVGGLSEDKDYAVSAHLSIERGTNVNGDVQTGTAAVVARANGEMTKGYEFGIGVTSSGTTFVRLYRRGENASGKVLYQSSTNIPGAKGGKIAEGETYDLRMLVIGERIQCYLNDMLVTEVADKSYASGFAGVRTLYAKAGFEDFTVRKIEQRTVESIEAVNIPEQISVTGLLTFDLKVTYNSVYGGEIIPSSAAGVTFEGLDGSTGTKTITVSYGGKTARFQVNVVKSLPETVLAEENFENGRPSWTYKEVNNAEFGFTYGFKAENGKMVADFPNVGAFNSPLTAEAYISAADSADWENYTVQAKVKAKGDSTTATAREGAAGLQFATGSGSAAVYNLRLTTSGNLLLYRHTTLLGSALLSDLGITFSKDKFYTLKVTVLDEGVLCYVNDKLAIVTADFSTAETTPYAGLRAINGSCEFDDFKVTAVEKKSPDAIDKISLVNAKLEPVTALEAKALDLSVFALMLHYTDGSIGVTGVTEEMLSGYNPTATGKQTVTVTYGKASTTFTFTVSEFLFKDTFDKSANSLWSFPASAQFTTKVNKEMLQVNFKRPEGSVSSYSYVMNVNGGEEWTDYAVSADVCFDKKVDSSSEYIGVTARKTNSYYYEFRLNLTRGTMKGELYRFSKNGSERLEQYSDTVLRTAAGVKSSLTTSVWYNIKLGVVGNEIQVYFNDALVSTFIDDSEFAQVKGNSGLKVVNTSALIDNYYVTPLRKKTIASMEVQSVNNATALYQGFALEPSDLSLKVNYDDGTSEIVEITDQMLSDFDSTVLGQHKVTVSYQDHSTTFTVTVESRQSYLDEFASKVQAIDPAALTEADRETVRELKKQFDSLSPYEVNSLAESVVTQYEAVTDAWELILYPELKGYDVIYRDAFNQNRPHQYIHSYENNSGKWLYRNGYYLNDMKTYGLVGSGWAIPNGNEGNVVSAEADIMMTGGEGYIGFGFNISSYGYYHVRLTNKTKDADGNMTYTLQLLKKQASGHKTLQTVLPADYNITIQPNEWHNLRMTLLDGALKVYMDDVLVMTHDDSLSNMIYTSGGFGLRNSEANGKFDNFKVRGTTADVYVKQIEPTVYTDNFDDETAGQNPSHWIETSGRDQWKVYADGDNKMYGVKGVSGYTDSWLHGFEEDPVYAARFKVSGTRNSAKAGFLIRRSSDTAYVRAGYDFQESKWYLEATEGVDFETQRVYADKTFPLEKNKWYDFEVSASGHSIEIKVDGQVVLSSPDTIDNCGFGRIGVYSDNADFYVDDVKATFKNGGAVTDGVTEVTVFPETYSNYLEIEELPNGNLLGVFAKYQFLSKDKGRTWTNITGQDYKTVCGAGYASILKMDNGLYIQVLYNELYVQVSKDMKNWETIGQVLPTEEQFDDDGNQLALFHVNTITSAKTAQGNTRLYFPVAFRRYNGASVLGHYTVVYYSDDYGKTWTPSETNTNDIVANYTPSSNVSWSESKVIKCSDGSLRMYYSRNEYGCMQYTESFDDGKTWQGMYPMPELQCAKSSFAVFADPYEEGTYYMVWVNDSPASLNDLQYRNRLSLVKSTDGKNWDFLMDVDRMSPVASLKTGSVHQVLDPSLYIDEDYIYITYGRSDAQYGPGAVATHNEQRAQMVRVEKSKLSVKPWNDATLADSSFPKTVEITTQPQVKFGKGDLFNVMDGELTFTAFNGRTWTQSMVGYPTLVEPNMYTLGKQTVTLYHPNGFRMSYDISIVPSYKVTWNVSEGGAVDSMSKKLLEGDTKVFTLQPDEGFGVASVKINGQEAAVTDNTFTVSDVKEELTIDVVFDKASAVLGGAGGSTVWIIVGIVAGVVVIAGGVTAGILLYRKKKQKAA